MNIVKSNPPWNMYTECSHTMVDYDIHQKQYKHAMTAFESAVQCMSADFLPPCVSHFNGCAAVCCLVKRNCGNVCREKNALC